MSGCVWNYWTSSPETNQLARVHRIAKELGEPKSLYEDLVKFIKIVSIEKLNKYAEITYQSNVRLNVPFGPIAESKQTTKQNQLNCEWGFFSLTY